MHCKRCGAWAQEGSSFCPSCGEPLTEGSSETEAQSAARSASATEVRTAYAGFWLRLIAYVIDLLILCAATLIVVVPLGAMFFGMRPPIEGPPIRPIATMFVITVWGLSIVGTWLYFALFESCSWQATPGKRALGLFVTDMQGRRISFARATGRYVGKILSGAILFIGYFMAGFTARKQALHDMLADTLVLRRI